MGNTIALTVVSAFVGFAALVAIGANDVPNSQAMAVGSGAIGLRGAQIIATIFEFLGAALVGQHVSSTVGEKIVDKYAVDPQQYAWGMLAALMSTGIWMFFATFIKMPVSTTHSIIGALIGFQLIIHNGDPKELHLDELGKIGVSWIVTPFMSFVLSIASTYFCDRWWPLYLKPTTTTAKVVNPTPTSSISMGEARVHVIEVDDALDDHDENKNLKTEALEALDEGRSDNLNTLLEDEFEPNYEPNPIKFSIIFAILSSTLILFILAAGPKSIVILGLVDWYLFVLIAIGSLLVMGVIGYFIEPFFRKKYIEKHYDTENETINLRKFNNMDYFSLLLVIASAAFSFAHGGNDVANVLGPFGQIYAYQKYGYIPDGAAIPFWLSAIAGCAIGFGFILFGKGVLQTVGKDIADVTYQTGFIAQYSAALTVLICDVMALPVSSSTVIVGAVYGIQFYNSMKEKRLRKECGKKKDKSGLSDEDNLAGLQKCLFRMKQMNLDTLAKILATWVITLPANAGLCAGIYAIINAIWG